MVTESTGKRWWCCGTGAWVIAALVVWACAPSAYAQEACAVIEQDRTFPDCNGDGIEDVDDIAQGTSLDANGNQIPDECDFQICDDLWDGFQPNPPFSRNKQISLIDYNGDGIYWDDPEGVGIIDRRGCGPNGSSDQTLKMGVHTADPDAGYVQSEYFRTLAGELDCGASKYSLAFQFKIDNTISDNFDWLYDIYDGVSDARVVQLAFPSLESEEVDPADQGYILVKNPAGTPEWINTGVALSLGGCKDIEVVLDNINDAVYVYVEGDLKVTTTRLTPEAYRMDYFKVNPINNNADPLIQDPELKLDEFRYCISGPVLMDWADCNGNCVDDLSDISNGLDTDCNANDIPDFCEADQNCSCGSAATSVACMACNHEHEWDFDTESPAFVTGDLDCQKGWTLEQTSAYPAAEIVSASGLPIPMSGRAVKLNPREGTAGDIPQGARGPRTRDEQPGMPGTGDAGMEYWEVDVVIDESPTSDGGDVMFVVWNMCDVFLNDDITNGVPVCFSNTAPTCYRVTGGESSTSVYARFNAGVRFRRWLSGDTKVEILSNGGWSQIVNGFHSRWYPDTVEHVNIRIDNNQDLITYWNGTHVVGQPDTNPVQSLAVDQNPNTLGDRQVLLLNNSAICTAYFDNLTYTTDDECDRDLQPDSLLLPGGAYNYGTDSDTNEDGVLDWCQDCNRNCVVDTDDIAGATSEDCNGNFIPDECDIDPSLPMYHMSTPSGQPDCPPDWDDIGPYYTLKGGGSLDTDTNGVPDECQEDCNDNGMLDWCELDCDHALCHPDGFTGPGGCGQADDCNGNNTPDDCEEDCNDNGVSDLCDITAGTSLDDNTNDVPDECDPDCDGNDTPDDIDIATAPGIDCDTTGVPDVCERMFPDCNGDDVEDACGIAAGSSLDCQPNGTPDECELFSNDYNINGIPDECDPCGDLDGDSDVDEDDYWAFVAAFGTCAGDANYHPLAEFDGDQCIGLADYQAWTQCYRSANGKDFSLGGGGGSKEPSDSHVGSGEADTNELPSDTRPSRNPSIQR